MKVTIDRHLCDHVLSECERCFGTLMRYPQGADRPCITEYVEDDDPILHLKLVYDDQMEVLDLEPEKRVEMGTQGWSDYVKVMPNFFRA